MTIKLDNEDKFGDDIQIIRPSGSTINTDELPDYKSNETEKSTSNTNGPTYSNTVTGALVPTEIIQTREETRGTLAMIFIVGFYIMLALGGLLVAFTNNPIDVKVQSLQDVFLVISGVLSGPLGFVVGYYFRRQDQQDV